jgi:hypothetical protein
MTALFNLCEWLYRQPWAAALRESDNVYPLVETAHVLAIAIMVGSVFVVDLRVLGVVLRGESVTRITGALLPVTWCGFGLMLVTGTALFAADAQRLYGNPAFRVKILLLALAGCNAFLFHWTAYRVVGDWESMKPTPSSARAFALSSIALWSAVVVSGRLIALFRGH